MKPKLRNRRLRCEQCGRRTEHAPVGRPVGRGERAPAVLLGLATLLCVFAVLALVDNAYLRQYFVRLPHLTSAFLRGGIAGGVGVGVPSAILGPRRVAIALYGQYFDWQCSLCRRIRLAKR